jgi:pimeloyl-ACP methyl ester carboxylesterase
VAPRRRDAVADLARFFLSNRRQHIGHELWHLATLGDRVDGDTHVVEFFPGAGALEDTPAKAMQPLHDHDGAGHQVHRTRPTEFLAAVRDFLDAAEP